MEEDFLLIGQNFKAVFHEVSSLLMSVGDINKFYNAGMDYASGGIFLTKICDDEGSPMK